MTEAEPIESVEPEDARELVGKNKARILDLREEKQYLQGRPATAVLTDREDPSAGIERATRRHDSGCRMLLLTENGEDVEDVASRVREAGHEVAVIEGGWEGWLDDDLPVEPRSDEEYDGPELKQPGAPEPTAEDEDQGEGEESASDDRGPDRSEPSGGERSERSASD